MSSDQGEDQALWARFKEASDQAYEPCHAHFAELDAIKARNRFGRGRTNQFIERPPRHHAFRIRSWTRWCDTTGCVAIEPYGRVEQTMRALQRKWWLSAN
jgi:hypothetical protein